MWRSLKETNQESLLAWAILILSSCAVVWATAPVWQSQNLNDDSFITLTYAKNLAAGRGFVFNHPPATLGTTTPGFTLLTALLAALFPAFTVAEAAIALSSAAWIGTGWVLYLIMRQLDFQPIAAAAAASIPLLIMHGWIGFIGMELLPFQFLLALSIYLALKEQVFLAGICVAALFLTRGEGALVGLMLFAYLWYRRRRLPLQFLLGGGATVSLWIVYAWLTFGTIIPNTLAAKQTQAQLPYWRNFFDRIMFELLPKYLSNFRYFDSWLLNPYLLLAGLGLLYALFQERKLLLFIAWGGAYLLGYTLLNPSAYYWYVLHIVFILQVMAGVGLAWLITLFRRSPSLLGSRAAGAAALLLAVSFLYFGYTVMRQVPSFTGDHRATTYRALAGWLNEHTLPEESVAFIEIGYLGYFSHNRIIDLAGLTDPLITAHLLSDGFAWGFWHYQPDYYIYAEEFDWALGDIKPELEAYAPVHQVERDTVSTPIYIYKRAN